MQENTKGLDGYHQYLERLEGPFWKKYKIFSSFQYTKDRWEMHKTFLEQTSYVRLWREAEFVERFTRKLLEKEEFSRDVWTYLEDFIKSKNKEIFVNYQSSLEKKIKEAPEYIKARKSSLFEKKFLEKMKEELHTTPLDKPKLLYRYTNTVVAGLDYLDKQSVESGEEGKVEATYLVEHLDQLSEDEVGELLYWKETGKDARASEVRTGKIVGSILGGFLIVTPIALLLWFVAAFFIK